MAGQHDLLEDLRNWDAESVEEEGDLPPTQEALATAANLRPWICNPSVWGSTGDGGFYVEEHREHDVIISRISPAGEQRISCFNSGNRVSPPGYRECAAVTPSSYREILTKVLDDYGMSLVECVQWLRSCGEADAKEFEQAVVDEMRRKQ